MSLDALFALAADAILISHVLFVLFVVLGTVMIFVGYVRSWQWVRHRWLRITHLTSIVFVAAQSWLGVICPLTIWEMQLRRMAGQNTYDGSFIQHWLHQFLYYDAPDWVFVMVYSAFATLVILSWIIVPPRRDQ